MDANRSVKILKQMSRKDETVLELALRKQAVKFDFEIIYWMEGFRWWIFVGGIIGIMGLFFQWFVIGYLGITVFMLYLIQKAINSKKRNMGLNKIEIKELSKDGKKN